MLLSRRYLFVTLGLVVLTITAFLFFFRTPPVQLDSFWHQAELNSSAVISHELWQEVLDEYLIADHASGISRVDYQALQESGLEGLQGYLEAMSAIDPRNYSRPEQFAFWVNLYNAVTVKLIAENYPVDSITELGETALAFGPWDDALISVAGKALSLNDIEHRILRPIWKDYRIHFAVNCASVGCPNLSAEAFTRYNRERLLEQSAGDYLQHPRGLRFEEDKLILSSIFDWYKEDFGGSQSERLQTLSEYLPETLADRVKNHQGPIDYHYDWQLNSD